MIALYSLLYIVFLFLDYGPIHRKSKRSVSRFYLSVIIFSYVLIILIALDFTIPSPTALIEKIVGFIIPTKY